MSTFIISGKDWLPVKADNFTFRSDEPELHFADDYFLFENYDSPFNLGIYQTITNRTDDNGNYIKNLKASKYVGVLPLIKRDSNKLEDRFQFIKISSRFGISPTKMLHEVLSGDDYYENPEMLKTKTYSLAEWKQLANPKQWKDDERILFGIINDAGKVNLSAKAVGEDETSVSDIGIADLCGVFEIIDFINKAKGVCKKTLKHQTQRVEENLNCKVKGRILIQKQIKNNNTRGQIQKVYCAFNKMTPDIKENQIIKYALNLCQKHEIGDALSEDIRFCMNALKGVPVRKCSISDFVGLKNNGAYRQYKDVLLAAKKVIGRYSVSYDSDNGADGSNQNKKSKAKLDNHTVLPFFIDIDLLFEYYCRALFKKSINKLFRGELALENTQDAERMLFDAESEVKSFYMKTYRPDIVIICNQKVAAVIDAKYSDIENMPHKKRERTHQILFYMNTLGCRNGGLISPNSNGRERTVEDSILINRQKPTIETEKRNLCYIPLGDNENLNEDLVDAYLQRLKHELDQDTSEKIQKRKRKSAEEQK